MNSIDKSAHAIYPVRTLLKEKLFPPVALSESVYELVDSINNHLVSNDTWTVCGSWTQQTINISINIYLIPGAFARMFSNLGGGGGGGCRPPAPYAYEHITELLINIALISYETVMSPWQPCPSTRATLTGSVIMQHCSPRSSKIVLSTGYWVTFWRQAIGVALMY